MSRLVGDSYTVGVLAEIVKRMLRITKRTFRVHHRLGAEPRTKPGHERLRMLQLGECSAEGEFVLRVQIFGALHELAPKHFFKNIDRQEELLLRVNPA